MEQTILNLALTICQNASVRLLYLCEFGSRSKGYAANNETSDYDICGVFVESSLDAYWAGQLGTNSTAVALSKRQIVRKINDNLEFTLWHITKALRHLFHDRNFSLYLWSLSPIIYYENDDFRRFRQYMLGTVGKINPKMHYGHARNIFHQCERILQQKEQRHLGLSVEMVEVATKRIIVCWTHLIYLLFALKQDHLPSINVENLLEAMNSTRSEKYNDFEIPGQLFLEVIHLRNNVDNSSLPSAINRVEILYDAAKKCINKFSVVKFDNKYAVQYDKDWYNVIKPLLPQV